MPSKFTSFFCFLIILVTFCQALEEPKLTCIDDLTDFEVNKWVYRPLPFYYLESSDDLPEIFQNHSGLSGSHGILFLKPNLTTANWYGIWGPLITEKLPTPLFLYVKYYGHIANPSAGKYLGVHPAKSPDVDNVKMLPENTETWAWSVALVELESVPNYLPAVFAKNYALDDYLLIEKVALSQGYEVEGVEDIEAKCGWSSGEVTTQEPPTTQKPPVSTTQSNGGSFECTATGYFADPQDCTKFHVCQYDDLGGLWDSVFTCPETTVWCQRTTECEEPVTCPCDL